MATLDVDGFYLANSPDAVLVVDANGSIEIANPRAEELFGYEPGELPGRNVDILVPDDLAAGHRRHRDGYRAAPKIRAMGDLSSELLGRRADGTRFPVEISLSPVDTETGFKVLACVRDVTDRQLLETEARRVRNALDAVNEAVFMFDPETLLFEYANDGAVEQLGYSRAELLGLMTPVDVAPEFDAESFRAIVARLTSAERDSLTYKTTHRAKGGTSLVVEVALQYHESTGPVDGVMVALARDLSDRQESERRARVDREARRIAEDRERIARDLHDVVIQRLFAAGMRLQSGLGNPVLLAERSDEAVSELDETIAVIRRTIFALTDRTVPAPSERIQSLADAHTDRTGVSVDLTVAGDLESVDAAILAGLEASLTEALSNVARHAAAQQVTVVVNVDEEVSLEVTDDGIGIAPTRSSGFGLRNIEARADELGGDFSITPDPDGGTRVCWRVPLHAAERDMGL